MERISASSLLSIDLSNNRWQEEFKFGISIGSRRSPLSLQEEGGERRVAVSSHRLYPVN